MYPIVPASVKAAVLVSLMTEWEWRLIIVIGVEEKSDSVGIFVSVYTFKGTFIELDIKFIS